MTSREINTLRLACQHITTSGMTKPAELVTWFGGMQAQDYYHSKWAIGMRLPELDDDGVEQAFVDRSLIRTWAFRGTLHNMAAPDVDWILRLVGPRIIASRAARFRQLELDAPLLKKCHKLLARHLQDGQQLSRPEIAALLQQSGITASGERLAHILYHTALERLVCLGTRKGKEYTYALLAPLKGQPDFKGGEALAELATRYFQSHGPASLRDFAWWSGLPLRDVRTGLDGCKDSLQKVTYQAVDYWMKKDLPYQESKLQEIFLMPGFDEYFIAYENRNIGLDIQHNSKVMTINGIFHPIVVHKGAITGTWKADNGKNKVQLSVAHFAAANAKLQKGIALAALQYSRFKGKTLELL